MLLTTKQACGCKAACGLEAHVSVYVQQPSALSQADHTLSLYVSNALFLQVKESSVSAKLEVLLVNLGQVVVRGVWDYCKGFVFTGRRSQWKDCSNLVQTAEPTLIVMVVWWKPLQSRCFDWKCTTVPSFSLFLGNIFPISGFGIVVERLVWLNCWRES